MKNLFLVPLLLLLNNIHVQDRPPIIDVHVHAWADRHFASGAFSDSWGVMSPETNEQHFEQTYAILKKYNITAILSGELENVERWMSKDIENRLIPSLYMWQADPPKIDSVEFEALVKEGRIKVLGEVLAWYKGSIISDPEWAPFLRICEKYDIPVGIHTGASGTDISREEWASKSRLYMADPLLIEEALIRHPNLRVYLMHAGEQFHPNTLRMMAAYSNVYAGLGSLLWGDRQLQRFGREFLQNAKTDGYINQVLFGTDQMFWPTAIERSIEYLNSLDFLNEQDKRDILYNNAVRFFKLNKN